MTKINSSEKPPHLLSDNKPVGDEGLALKSNDNKKSSLRTLNLSRCMPFQVSINIYMQDDIRSMVYRKEYEDVQKNSSNF